MSALERALVGFLNRPRRQLGRRSGCSIGSGCSIVGEQPLDAALRWEPAQHTFICGRTGSGKTTALLRVIEEHVRASVPFLFIDFHGPATEQVLAIAASVPGNAPIVLLEPASDPVIGFNPLDTHGKSPYPVVHELVSVFRHRLWPDAWGPRMEEVIRQTLLALSDANLTLLEATRFLSSAEFRRAILSRGSLIEVREFWTLRFERLSPSQKALMTEVVLNKLSVFLDPAVKYVVGQRPGTLDLDEALASGQTIVMNLSAGQLWSNNLLLGALLVAKLKSAVYRRKSTKPYSIILDEFQELVALESLDDYLRSFRKFGCSVYLATQHLQFTPEMRASVFGNCARFICFATSRRDAAYLGTEFGEPEDKVIARMLPDLPTGTAVMKVRGQRPLVLKVQPSNIRVTNDLITRGRDRCLALGQSRMSIDKDIRQRSTAVRPTVVRFPAVAKARRGPALAVELPEGYEDDSF